MALAGMRLSFSSRVANARCVGAGPQHADHAAPVCDLEGGLHAVAVGPDLTGVGALDSKMPTTLNGVTLICTMSPTLPSRMRSAIARPRITSSVPG
jgi:hypothetical protein